MPVGGGAVVRNGCGKSRRGEGVDGEGVVVQQEAVRGDAGRRHRRR